MKCQVCLSPSDGKHFNVQGCRSCSSFFRRTIVKNLTYECKTNGKCQIHRELRKRCSACRFEKCKAIGMSAKMIQTNRDKNGPLKGTQRRSDVAVEEKDSQNKTISPSNLFSTQIPQSSLLSSLQESIKTYLQGEKFVHFMLYPNFQQNNLVLITHDEYVEMDRACLPLLNTFIAQFCPMYDQLSISVKTTILQRFYFQTFNIFKKTYISSLFQDMMGENMWIVNYGQYITLDSYFYRDKDPEYSLKSCEKSCKMWENLYGQIKEIKLREVEFAALCGISLANEVGMIFKNDVMSEFRNQIYSELHADIVKNYKVDDVELRIFTLVSMITLLDHISNEEDEHIVIRKLMNGHILEVFGD